MTFRNKDKIPSPNLPKNTRSLVTALSTDILVYPDPSGNFFCYIGNLIMICLMDSG